MSQKVLFFTSSEYGQAQVVFAIIHDLLGRDGVEVHLASFPDLYPRVVQIQDVSSKIYGRPQKIHFHELGGPNMFQAFSKNGKEVGDLAHPPGVAGALEAYSFVPFIISAWNPPDYLQICESASTIINTVQPSHAIIDAQLSPALDACRRDLPGRCILVSPISLNQHIAPVQPWAGFLWKYPAFCSGLPFPVPWSLILANMYLQFRLVFTFAFSTRIRELMSARRKARLTGWSLPAFDTNRSDEQYISPSLPELDYPFTIRENITTCGPLTLPTLPISETDSELLTWLGRRRTVLINLGSLVKSTASDVREMGMGLRIALDTYSDFQVLWKLKAAMEDETTEILERELASGRVRITPWLNSDPISIMRSGHVCCSVHHGGGNSFYEAIECGVPHVVLPVWYDTYDFANHATYLGVGVWANRSHAPHVDAAEFSTGLLAVLGTEQEQGRNMRDRARHLAAVSRRAGGRAKAGARIMDLLARSKRAD